MNEMGRGLSATRVDGPTTIGVNCPVCGEAATYPNKGLGRASAAAWMTRHQHREKAPASTPSPTQPRGAK